MSQSASGSDERRRLLERLVKKQNVSVDRLPIPSVGRSEGSYPLSFTQERLWFLHQLNPSDPAYHVVMAVPLSFEVHDATLRATLDALVQRHEGLRTAFPVRSGIPAQSIGDQSAYSFESTDLTSLDPSKREEALTELVQAMARRPFDLARGPVFRPHFVRTGDTPDYLIFNLHHIVTDGWSAGLILRDFVAIYTGVATGKPPQVPPLTVQVADFAVWQRRLMSGDDFAEDLTYWRNQLTGSKYSSLPTDRPPSRQATGVAGVVVGRVDPAVVRSLRTLGRECAATPFMTLLAGFVGFLSRLTGQTDISVGTPAFGYRERAELVDVVGCFLNTLVLRVDVSGEPSVRDLVKRVQKVSRDGFARQHVPFEAIVAEVGADRAAGRNPLINVTFTLEQPDPNASEMLGGQTLGRAIGVSAPASRFDLEVNVTLSDDELIVGFTYASDLLDEGTAERWLSHYVEVLEAMAGDSSSPLNRLMDSSDSLLSTTDFLAHLRSLGVKIRADGDKLRVNAETGTLTPALKADLARRKPDLLAVLRDAARSGASAPIPRIPRDGPLVVSRAQQRLWFLDQLGPGSPAYNIATAMKLGHLEERALAAAFDDLVARHETLRSTFPKVGGEARLVIHDPSPGHLEIIDLRSLGDAERSTRAAELAAARSQTGFDLGKGPLFRACLLQLGSTESVLIVVMHHIISDGWSMEVISRELGALYQARLVGASGELPDLPIQYADFAAWQEERLSSGAVADQLAYWTRQLGGALPIIELPTDRPRPPVQTLRGARRRVAISEDLVQELKALSHQEGATLFMTLLTAFKTLVFRYTGETDLVVGAPTAGRDRPELEAVVGFFVNNVVLRTDAGDRPTFREYLRQVRKVMLTAHANQEVPFDQLVDVLRPERSMSHPPLFQIMFNSPTVPVQDYRDPAAGAEVVEVQVGTSRFDLTVEVTEVFAAGLPGSNEGRRVTGALLDYEFNTDLFDEETILRFHRCYVQLLESVIERPDERISMLGIVPREDQEELLVTWNGTDRDYPRELCVHELFEARAAEHPDRIAVRAGDETLTYGELEARSEALAHELRGSGVGPDVLVGLSVDRSVDMLVGTLGIMKAGGAYIPLDPAYPRDRLAFMLEDSGATVLVGQAGLEDSLPTEGLVVINLDEDRPPAPGDPDSTGRPAGPENLAYVIYTSGSTGRPKGVQVQHRSVVNFLTAMASEPGLTSEDVLLAVTTLSFDIAGLELFLPLSVGAQVTLASRAEATDPMALASLIQSSGATVMQATPATWRLLIQSGWKGAPGLRMLCGGEALDRELCEQLRPMGESLWNLYGPTEATIWSTLLRVDDDVEWPVSIGRPIANTQIYILDDHLSPVPIGVAGELYIGGDGLARGYLNRPELTAERFVPDPFADAPSARMYRTGDGARYRRDGTIEYLGRLDTQVKVRGFRIELGEIESCLNEHEGVVGAAVSVREDIPGDQRLVAYVVSRSDDVDPLVLQRELKTVLPDYMVPATYVSLDKLPLTPNGKVDRKALPPPGDVGTSAKAAFVAPENEIERVIAEVWQEVLRVDEVGRNDNFFDLGGHSLLAVQVHSALLERLERAPSLIDLFQFTTVAGLAQFLATDEAGPSFERAQARAERQLGAGR